MHAAPTIRHAEVAGRRVILDLRSERYLVLDDVASTMWAALLDATGVDDALRTLTQRYRVEADALARDLAAFRSRCLADGLLCVEVAAPAFVPVLVPPRKRRRRPSVLVAWCCLAATGWSIARRGFAGTYARYAALPRADAVKDESAALLAFARAENFYVAERAPDDCLVRSLALYRFLNACGIRAEHVIGVQRVPFHAHAWVDVAGRPALNTSTLDYVALARL